MRTVRRPSGVAGGPSPFFFRQHISPRLRFGPALLPATEEALGQPVSEYPQDGSSTTQAQIGFDRVRG